MTYGDENTKIFHQSLKKRRTSNCINVLHVDGFIVSDMDRIHQAFNAFYFDLQCCVLPNRRKININVIHTDPVLNDDLRSQLNLSFSADEIKRALWSIPDSKAPGLEGYNNKFYKAAWPVMGNDIVSTIQQFFVTDKLLKVWNATAITLMPKVPNPTVLGDFRPIACVHTLYTCISKLICSRVSMVLNHLISPNQGAFVAGRSIMQNILLCQDIIRHYTKSCAPSCL